MDYKFHPIEKLAKADWKAFNPKTRWDIITALRGPDLQGKVGQRLKWLTTAVIRHKMWNVAKPEGGSAMTNEELPCVVLPEGNGLSGLGLGTGFDSSHFCGHIAEAAVFLNIPHISMTPTNYAEMLKASDMSPKYALLMQLKADTKHNGLIQKGLIAYLESGGSVAQGS